LAFEFLVLADVGRNHLADLPRLQKEPQAEGIEARVIGDDRQVARTEFAHCRNQVLGDAASAETARHQHHTVAQNVAQRTDCVGKYLGTHALEPPNEPSSPANLAPQYTQAAAKTSAGGGRIQGIGQ
jgi:hypothetical protein